MQEIGRLRILRRYPVKSFKGEDLERAFVTYAGVVGDRVYAFVDPAKTDNFPWVTARQVPEMILFEPRFTQPPSEQTKYPDRSRFDVEVKTPEGQAWSLSDPAFVPYLETRWKRPLTLRFSEKGMQDSRPVSILAFETVHALAAEVALPMDHRRFRANFYVEWNNATPFHEDSLAGKTLQVGEKLKLYVQKKTTRCTIINLEPATAQPTPEVLKTVGKNHKGCVGVYASIVEEGVVQPGDPIFEA